ASFRRGGKATTAFGGAAGAAAVALQADGKLVAAGRGGAVVALARYTPNGGLDTGFGPPQAAGRVTTTVGTSSGAAALALQADGKILVAGSAQVGGVDTFAVLRYLSTPPNTVFVNGAWAPLPSGLDPAGGRP